MPTKATAAGSKDAETESATCGLIMPISAIDGVSAEHWAEVRAILTESVEAVKSPVFAVRLVSDADEAGIIQKRIVHNVYGSAIIVCDVSGKNPNVMFELGMRLAFDKPVVIVKDDKTDYSFDTGIIEHLTYPRDLRFTRIVEFKAALAAKVVATYRAAASPDHSPFLKNFGQFHVASLAQTEVSPEKLTLEMLDELRREVGRLSRRLDSPSRRPMISTSSLEFEGQVAILKFLASNWDSEKYPDEATAMADNEFLALADRVCEPHRYFENELDFHRALEQGISNIRRILKSDK